MIFYGLLSRAFIHMDMPSLDIARHFSLYSRLKCEYSINIPFYLPPLPTWLQGSDGLPRVRGTVYHHPCSRGLRRPLGGPKRHMCSGPLSHYYDTPPFDMIPVSYLTMFTA
jgi:hypothetical protein